MKKLVLGLAIACIFMSIAIPVYAEGDTLAKVMRLEDMQGTVSAENANGKAVKLKNNAKLYNGYNLKTEVTSYAYINLDDKKAIKLDQKSAVSVKKNKKNLELLVKSGQVFFNVKEKLATDETMQIRTSNMVTGIRGTIGVAAQVSDNHTVFYLLEGEVVLFVADDGTGNSGTVTVKAGEIVDIVTEIAKPNSEVKTPSNSTSMPEETLVPGTDGTITKKVESVTKRKLVIDEIGGYVAKEIEKDEVIRDKLEKSLPTTIAVKEIVATAQEKIAKEEKAVSDKETNIENKLEERKNTQNKQNPIPEKAKKEEQPPVAPKAPATPTPTPPATPTPTPPQATPTPTPTPPPVYKKYTVTYDACGGFGAPPSGVKTEGTAYSISSILPTAQGGTFIGWNTSSDGSGQMYARGSSYTLDAPVTLYAQWDGFKQISAKGLTADALALALADNDTLFVATGGESVSILLNQNLEIAANKLLQINGGGVVEFSNQKTRTRAEPAGITVKGDLLVEDTKLALNVPFNNSGNISIKGVKSSLESTSSFSINSDGQLNYFNSENKMIAGALKFANELSVRSGSIIVNNGSIVMGNNSIFEHEKGNINFQNAYLELDGCQSAKIGANAAISSTNSPYTVLLKKGELILNGGSIHSDAKAIEVSDTNQTTLTLNDGSIDTTSRVKSVFSIGNPNMTFNFIKCEISARHRNVLQLLNGATLPSNMNITLNSDDDGWYFMREKAVATFKVISAPICDCITTVYPSPIEACKQDVITMPSVECGNRIEHRFLGWTKAANGTGELILAGQNITLAEDVTYYAQWENIDVLTGELITMENIAQLMRTRDRVDINLEGKDVTLTLTEDFVVPSGKTLASLNYYTEKDELKITGPFRFINEGTMEFVRTTLVVENMFDNRGKVNFQEIAHFQVQSSTGMLMNYGDIDAEGNAIDMRDGARLYYYSGMIRIGSGASAIIADETSTLDFTEGNIERPAPSTEYVIKNANAAKTVISGKLVIKTADRSLIINNLPTDNGIANSIDPSEGFFIDKKMQLVFNANQPGGDAVTNLPTPINKVKGELVYLPEEIPAAPGYKFMGWSLLADGSGTLFAKGSDFEIENTATASGVINMYAAWELEDFVSPTLTAEQINEAFEYNDIVKWTPAAGDIENAITIPASEVLRIPIGKKFIIGLSDIDDADNKKNTVKVEGGGSLQMDCESKINLNRKTILSLAVPTTIDFDAEIIANNNSNIRVEGQLSCAGKITTTDDDTGDIELLSLNTVHTPGSSTADVIFMSTAVISGGNTAIIVSGNCQLDTYGSISAMRYAIMARDTAVVNILANEVKTTQDFSVYTISADAGATINIAPKARVMALKPTCLLSYTIAPPYVASAEANSKGYFVLEFFSVIDFKTTKVDGTELAGALSPIYKKGGVPVVLPTFSSLEDPSYRILSWNTKKDGTGTSYEVGARYEIDDAAGVTLYAIWDTSFIVT